MSGIAQAVMGAGTVMSAMGQYSSGQAAAAAGVAQQQGMNYQAAELHNQANSVMGAASAQAANQATQTGLVLSNERAMAAGNTGSTNISSVTRASQIAGRGELDLLTDIANGQNKAAGLNAQSALDTFQGTQAYQAGLAKRKASQVGAIGSVMSGAGSIYLRTIMGNSNSLYDKYGNGGSGAAGAAGDDGFASDA